MSRKWLVVVALAAAVVIAALAGVERVAGRHPNSDVPVRMLVTPEAPSLPSAAELDVEPSASPALTR